MGITSQIIWQRGFSKSWWYGRSIVGYLTRKFKKEQYDLDRLRIALVESKLQCSCSQNPDFRNIKTMDASEMATAILDAKDSTEEYKSIDTVFPLLTVFLAVALNLAKDIKIVGSIVTWLFLLTAIAYTVYLLVLAFIGWFYTNPRIKLIEALTIIANETTKEEQQLQTFDSKIVLQEGEYNISVTKTMEQH